MILNPPESLTKLFNPCNDFSSDQKQNSDDIRSSKCYNIDEIQSLNKLIDKHSLSFFHIDACSLTKNIIYKSRNDLCIYKTAELETTFIELINTKKSNIIIGAIYRNPNIYLDDYIYINPLLDKMSRKSKRL